MSRLPVGKVLLSFYCRDPVFKKSRFFKIQGFTIIEIMVVLALIGVLASISAPSFFKQLNQAQVEDSLLRLQGAIRETQAEAIRRSQTCSITIPRGIEQTVSGDCLITGDRPLKGVEIFHNKSGSIPNWDISFDYKGRNQNFNNQGTLVIDSLSDSSVTPKCLVISIGIGLMRIGDYSGNSESISAVKCKTS